MPPRDAADGSQGHAQQCPRSFVARVVPTGRVADGVNDLGLGYYSDLVRSSAAWRYEHMLGRCGHLDGMVVTGLAHDVAGG